MKHKKFWLWIVSIIAIVSVICVGAGFYFFNVACVPSHKSFVSANSDVVKKQILYISRRNGIMQLKKKSGICLLLMENINWMQIIFQIKDQIKQQFYYMDI